MKFKKITIESWKQFERVDIDFHDKLTILTGANGSGKTTLLNILAKHFGWNFNELATPAKDKSTGIIKFFNRLFRTVSDISDNVIGTIHYDNGQIAKLILPNNVGAEYQIEVRQMQHVPGLNIVSHRQVFRYQCVPSISTQKISKQHAYDLVKNSTFNSIFNNGGDRPANYYIKETLLNWAIGGSGNEFIQADPELKANFKGFEKVLYCLLPKNIGFKNISIRNYEIVLVTNSGEFMLDSVSGGLSAIIDLGWQIYNYTNFDNPESKDCVTVLIDEVENHLHASMQRAILPDLLDAFPNVQFIVSTHSPLIVGSVKDSHVYAFRYNSMRKVYNEQLDLANKAKTATEILNEVLGVPFTMPVWVEDALNEIVRKYSNMEVNETNTILMRGELKAIGLESLMPLAISNLFK